MDSILSMYIFISMQLSHRFDYWSSILSFEIN